MARCQGPHGRHLAFAQPARHLRLPPAARLERAAARRVQGRRQLALELDAAALVREPDAGISHTLRLGGLINDDGDTGLEVHAQYPGHILTVAATGQGKSNLLRLLLPMR